MTLSANKVISTTSNNNNSQAFINSHLIPILRDRGHSIPVAVVGGYFIMCTCRYRRIKYHKFMKIQLPDERKSGSCVRSFFYFSCLVLPLGLNCIESLFSENARIVFVQCRGRQTFIQMKLKALRPLLRFINSSRLHLPHMRSIGYLKS